MDSHNINNAENAEKVIQALAPFVTLQRQQLITEILEKRLGSIHIALEAPYDILNVAAVTRTCEVLGIQHLHVIHTQNKKMRARGITRGAFQWVCVTYYDSTQAFFQAMHEQEIAIAGACLDAKTSSSELPIEKPLCLLLGNEHLGLSDYAKQQSQLQYSIPMYGMSESLNLSVSAAISLYDVTTRKRQSLGKAGDLSAEQILLNKAKFYTKSVDQRILENLKI